MLILTLERFIGVAFPFKYKIMATTKNISRILTAFWIAGIIGIVFSTLFASDVYQCYSQSPEKLLTFFMTKKS